MNYARRFVPLCLITMVLSATSVIAQPKYTPCPKNNPGCYNKDLGHTARTGDCRSRCVNGEFHISPTPIEACEGQLIQQINARIEPPTLANHGDQVVNSWGGFDWDDGSPEQPLPGSLNIDMQHTYKTARTYYPSGEWGSQHKYDGAGACSYECNLEQASIAIIYLKTGPECASGTFQPTEHSKQSVIALREQLNAQISTVGVSKTPGFKHRKGFYHKTKYTKSK